MKANTEFEDDLHFVNSEDEEIDRELTKGDMEQSIENDDLLVS